MKYFYKTLFLFVNIILFSFNSLFAQKNDFRDYYIGTYYCTKSYICSPPITPSHLYVYINKSSTYVNEIMFIDSTLTINDSVSCYAIIDSLGSIISGDWGINGSFINHDSLHINLPISSPQCYGFWYNGKKISSSNILTETLDDKTLIIFPNPAKEQATLYFSENGITNITIYNIFGREVYCHNMQNSKGANSETINVSGWAKGMYIVKASTNEGIKTSKLLVE